MTDLEIAKTLKDAAQYIRDHGWCQGSYGFHGGPRCAIGAYSSACGESIPSLEQRNLPPAPLQAVHDALQVQVWAFNDAPERTAAEVTDLFESVALQHELRALAVTTLSQDAAAAVCDNAVPEAVNA